MTHATASKEAIMFYIGLLVAFGLLIALSVEVYFALDAQALSALGR